MDTAFTQHKHDQYFLQTKGQKPVDKEIFERHLKLTRCEFVAHMIVLGYLLVKKNWCQSRPHVRFIVTMAL